MLRAVCSDEPRRFVPNMPRFARYGRAQPQPKGRAHVGPQGRTHIGLKRRAHIDPKGRARIGPKERTDIGALFQIIIMKNRTSAVPLARTLRLRWFSSLVAAAKSLGGARPAYHCSLALARRPASASLLRIAAPDTIPSLREEAQELPRTPQRAQRTLTIRPQDPPVTPQELNVSQQPETSSQQPATSSKRPAASNERRSLEACSRLHQ